MSQPAFVLSFFLGLVFLLAARCEDCKESDEVLASPDPLGTALGAGRSGNPAQVQNLANWQSPAAEYAPLCVA